MRLETPPVRMKPSMFMTKGGPRIQCVVQRRGTRATSTRFILLLLRDLSYSHTWFGVPPLSGDSVLQRHSRNQEEYSDLKDFVGMTRKLVSIILLGLLLSLGSALVCGQSKIAKTSSKAAPRSSDMRLLPLDDVRAGMKGVARTVFAGSDTEEFGVEILGVLPGFPGARQSTIIGRLSGSNVDRTGVFAGMSGSPVFIDGRLVGAIAYSFPFSKEPICGITPIAQMIEIFQQ